MTASLSVRRQPGSGRPVAFLHGLASSGAQDWPDAEWGEELAGRPRVVVDLPAHGASPALGAAPTSRVLDALAEALGGEEADVIAYSLGARLAWDLAAHPGVRIRRLVLGGLAAGEPFALVDLPSARAALVGGAAPADPLTGMIVHMATLPGNRPADVLDLVEGLAAEPFDPAAAAPRQPVLLVGGVDDGMAAGIDELAALLPDAVVERVPGDHVAALHSAEFRRAAAGFLAD
ncbi:alpha/beta fold hydrolase [Streptomyces sp. AC495_CC817]|uniref:alpha/beta fold hydrolase n=1 Tax=Streptomyces sp. AC495_CC817 TaxID=2823900 RepID=UPI001C280C1A|nr:alpha/beta hydrolase [Streptomyces sp. AC495_CC817]